MEPLYYKHWPKDVPKKITLPKTPLYYNLDVSAARYPEKTAISYYGSRISYARIKTEVDALAGYLQKECGVKKGDRVLLFMQNSPQFIIAYYAVLRADAVLVPSNPMNLTGEMRHYIKDAGVSVAICGAELCHRLEPLIGTDGLKHIIVANYGDYITEPTDLPIPDTVQTTTPDKDVAGFIKWEEALSTPCQPGPHLSNHQDLAAIIYTSGTTGEPKGCMHTHETLMVNTLFPEFWQGISSGDTLLCVVPLFHVTGMQLLMNASIYVGAEIVVMTRWDRELALQLIERNQVTNWTNIPTMVIDLFASPNLRNDSLKSLKYIGGGGAAMPEAVAKRLYELSGLSYVEGYGLTETAAPTHSNHLSRPKPQCLGIPIFNTESLIVEPGTLEPLGPNQNGEIVVRGPQIFKGYWNKPQATQDCFMEIGGRTFFRTGDLGYYDEEGYFFIVDRLKRMINASGFKVWPAEVEALMYSHPDIQEACIISSNDAYRGETVKAVVVLKEASRQNKDMAQNIINWCKERMAAYKYPRIIEFVDALPKSGSGKVQWRLLQENEKPD
ncbi:MAG: long-chain fatty acid--CoA ligase [Proteobacteria bacterium]|nr:long-chain fatty acid--CoA ligase [Pseudomonadota bacterium]MBU4472165.1 long-chain fatty acid--CoA ligase [Pseudomonadota bacterium]MCG2753833.1 long-chain fatty acid--CoA ligase [Desulfobacteraceae bacterium]